jgi:serine protease AprX
MRQRSTRFGGGYRRFAALGLAIAAVLVPGAASAALVPLPNATAQTFVPFVPTDLLDAARANPQQSFRVIVQSRIGDARAAGDAVAAAVAKEPGGGRGELRRFTSVAAVAAEVSGSQLIRIAADRNVFAITKDAPMRASSYSSRQQWPYVSGAAKFWSTATSTGLPAPAIAVVDSGIDASRADFGGRVVRQVTLTSRLPNSAGDGRGHGTFVASIAAGGAQSYSGAAPNAPIVSLDVVDDTGVALTSDVIAAADWILANKAAYGIRVANFSLHTSIATSIRVDPLNRAVERLWLNGVVVVAAAGNFGDTTPGVPYAPANDPFVITVGAADIAGSVSTGNDFAAPWSSHGATPDGFTKPDLSAPGRYMVGAVPAGATLALERPDRIVAPGYMQLSGTSFAAPVVAGAAAAILAQHPDWTPDMVKGALMVSAKPMASAVQFTAGVGEVDAAAAAAVVAPPNPNAALNAFVYVDLLAGGLRSFDAASWTSAALLSESWDAASWTSASWTSASWTSASWTSASWTSASWTSASWTSASWTSASWTSLSVSDASWTSNAEDDAIAAGGYWITAEDLAAAEAELGIAG